MTTCVDLTKAFEATLATPLLKFETVIKVKERPEVWRDAEVQEFEVAGTSNTEERRSRGVAHFSIDEIPATVEMHSDPRQVLLYRQASGVFPNFVSHDELEWADPGASTLMLASFYKTPFELVPQFGPEDVVLDHGVPEDAPDAKAYVQVARPITDIDEETFRTVNIHLHIGHDGRAIRVRSISNTFKPDRKVACAVVDMKFGDSEFDPPVVAIEPQKVDFLAFLATQRSLRTDTAKYNGIGEL